MLVRLFILLSIATIALPASAASQPEDRQQQVFLQKSAKPAKLQKGRKSKEKKEQADRYKRVSNQWDAEIYLKEQGIHPNQYDKELVKRLEAGDCMTAAALINAGARLNAAGDEKKPFLLAAEFGDEQLLRLMVKKGVDINCIDRQPNGIRIDVGNTAPFMAARGNKVKNLRYLDSIGLSCLSRSKDGQQANSVLGMAAEHGSLDCVKYILRQGGDPHETYFGNMNLMIKAAGSGNLELVKYLDSLGVDIHRVCSVFGTDVLGRAAMRKAFKGGDDSIMQYFLKRGVNAEKNLGMAGLRAFHFVVQSCTVETVKLMEQQGVNLNMMNNDKKHALHEAAQACNAEVVEYLCKKGYRIDNIDRIRFWKGKTNTEEIMTILKKYHR